MIKTLAHLGFSGKVLLAIAIAGTIVTTTVVTNQHETTLNVTSASQTLHSSPSAGASQNYSNQHTTNKNNHGTTVKNTVISCLATITKGKNNAENKTSNTASPSTVNSSTASQSTENVTHGVGKCVSPIAKENNNTNKPSKNNNNKRIFGTSHKSSTPSLQSNYR